ncbi:MAG: DUF108 domain-containing protein [Candidatus Omnitrophica bacterium]|nr:DUF108 domain-containing protein [Candidatus Omnitrophota bacterium]
MMTRVGIVGCGAIGSALAKAVDRSYADRAKVVALADCELAHAKQLQQQLRSRPSIVSIPELIRRSQLVVEAASVSVAERVARLALAADRDVLVMSAGGLLAGGWRPAARRSRGRLYVPSGALSGLDGLKAMALGTIRRIRLTTTKPPKALASAPGVRALGKRLEQLRRRRVVFRGSPAQAVRAFPQNTNVAATMALGCAWQTARPSCRVPMTVQVVADPAAIGNRHELEIEADCGRISVRVESRPSAKNPRTSELAIRSALASLAQLLQPVRIGT